MHEKRVFQLRHRRIVNGKIKRRQLFQVINGILRSGKYVEIKRLEWDKIMWKAAMKNIQHYE